jgi:hypothetical protein
LPIKETLGSTCWERGREKRESGGQQWMNGCKLGTSFIHLFTRCYCELISMSFSFWEVHGTIPILTRAGVSHYGLAIYIKTYLKAKEELWKLKYFTI